MHTAALRTPARPTPPLLRWAGPLRLVALGLLGACLFAAPAVAASGKSSPGKGDLQPLWQGYPLDPGAGHVNRTSVPKRTRVRPAPVDHGGGGSSVVAPFAAAGGSLLLAAFATLVVLRSRRTRPSLRKGVRMSRFLNRRSDRKAGEDTSDEIREVIAGRPETVDEEAAQPEVAAAAAPEAPSEPMIANDGSRVGEHVQAVLKAAEDAAARLLREARAQAQETRNAAEREASSRLEAATVTATRLTEEAERAHAEALAAAAQTRAAAEDETARRRTEAEEGAAQVLADAEREALAFGEDAAARYDALLDNTQLAEGRLRRLVEGLRDVADRLDDLLEPEEDEEPEETASAATDEALSRSDEPSLEEAIDPSAPTAGTWAR